MATTPQISITKQNLEMVATQLSFALMATKDVPSDVRETAEAFIAALRKWSESKEA